MDNLVNLSEVQRREHSVQDLHTPGPGGAVVLQPEDLRDLRLRSPEDVATLLKKYSALNIPRDNVAEFTAHLVARKDSYFVEAGNVGLFYFTNIVPHVDARFNMIFWDLKLTADRRACAQLVLSAAFELFNLARVSSEAVESNGPLRKTLLKIGFTNEGVLRRARIVDGAYESLYLYGILAEETTWPVMSTSLV